VNLSPFKLTILLSRYLTSFFGSWNITQHTGKDHICTIYISNILQGEILKPTNRSSSAQF
jgi:hypothetical protein